MEPDANKNLFNEYADSYKESVEDAISFSGLDADFFTAVKMEFLLEQLSDLGHRVKILDVGCGVGGGDSYLISCMAGRCELHGVDVSDESLAIAQKKNPQVNYRLYDGKRLPYADGEFEVVFMVNVMHHVPPGSWQLFLRECYRVLRSRGRLFVFEHNPHNPFTQVVVKRCEFDANAVLLTARTMRSLVSSFSQDEAKVSYLLFFPFRHRVWRKLERALERIPLGAQYALYLRKDSQVK